jgi:hypothetical protein
MLTEQQQILFSANVFSREMEKYATKYTFNKLGSKDPNEFLTPEQVATIVDFKAGFRSAFNLLVAQNLPVEFAEWFIQTNTHCLVDETLVQKQFEVWATTVFKLKIDE